VFSGRRATQPRSELSLLSSNRCRSCLSLATASIRLKLTTSGRTIARLIQVRQSTFMQLALSPVVTIRSSASFLISICTTKVPKQLSAQFFLSRDQSRRLTLINEVFSAYEKRQKVKDRIVNLTEYFTWASEIRNMLLHAEVYPTLLRDDIAFNIIKRKGRYTLDSGYQSFGLLQLRDYADKIQEGRLQAAKIAVHLRYRDTKPQYRSGALQRHGLEPFPRKLDLPEMPQLWESPHAGPTPQPQRRQRARKHR